MYKLIRSLRALSPNFKNTHTLELDTLTSFDTWMVFGRGNSIRRTVCATLLTIRQSLCLYYRLWDITTTSRGYLLSPLFRCSSSSLTPLAIFLNSLSAWSHLLEYWFWHIALFCCFRGVVPDKLRGGPWGVVPYIKIIIGWSLVFASQGPPPNLWYLGVVPGGGPWLCNLLKVWYLFILEGVVPEMKLS